MWSCAGVQLQQPGTVFHGFSRARGAGLGVDAHSWNSCVRPTTEHVLSVNSAKRYIPVSDSDRLFSFLAASEREKVVAAVHRTGARADDGRRHRSAEMLTQMMRRMVSREKRRYTDNGYDLDLS